METPEHVIIRNERLGDKDRKAVLVAIDGKAGFYEVNIELGGKTHRALLPIASTVVVCREPEIEYASDSEIER